MPRLLPFIDENPEAKPEARYKATGASMQTDKGVWAYQSADGIHWTPMANGPVFTKGVFDSQNVSFWSAKEQQYVLYYRIFSEPGFQGTRLVNRALSKDFIHWTDEGPIKFPEREGPQFLAQYYVNQIKPYERAPHLYVGFPARYVDHGLTPSTKQLPEWDLREKRMTVSPRYGTAFTDSVFITSRDGRNFRQSNHVFLAPGLRTKHNWSYGDNYIARHVVETASTKDDSPRELSLYATESYFTGRNSRLRRYSLRIDGFSSMHAKLQPGEFVAFRSAKGWLSRSESRQSSPDDTTWAKTNSTPPRQPRARQVRRLSLRERLAFAERKPTILAGRCQRGQDKPYPHVGGRSLGKFVALRSARGWLSRSESRQSSPDDANWAMTNRTHTSTAEVSASSSPFAPTIAGLSRSESRRSSPDDTTWAKTNSTPPRQPRSRQVRRLSRSESRRTSARPAHDLARATDHLVLNALGLRTAS